MRTVDPGDCDPVGDSDVAERLGVKPDTVRQWRNRDLDFPPPRWKVSGAPAFNWPDVEQWARDTNRLPT